MAQSIELPTLDFGTGYGLGVLGWSLSWGSLLSRESASAFSLSLCPLPPLARISSGSLSLK